MGALIAFLHHLGAFAFVGSLVAELVAIGDEVDERNAKRIIVIDFIYASSATFVLVVGFVRVYYFEKGSDYYWSSVAFLAKLSLFAVIALLSFYPSLEILRWRKSLSIGNFSTPPAGKVSKIAWIVKVELVLVLLLILSAVLTAKGIGYSA